MLDDRGDPIHAVLRDCMYVPGLSRRLFSVTKFAQNGHFATIKKNAITLYFGDNQSPVTLCSNQADTLAADAKISAPIGKSDDTLSKQVPSSRHRDNSNKKRISLELLHHRLGHRKCRTILAAADGDVWRDTTVRMSPEQGCVTCGISTIRATARNNHAHTTASKAAR